MRENSTNTLDKCRKMRVDIDRIDITNRKDLNTEGKIRFDCGDNNI